MVNIRQHEEMKLLNEKLYNEARRVKSLERESDRLRSEISLLEAKVGITETYIDVALYYFFISRE